MSTDEKIIKNKVALVKLSETPCSVPEACKLMGYSRDCFYRFKELHTSDLLRLSGQQLIIAKRRQHGFRCSME